jgi:hypothetical protein
VYISITFEFPLILLSYIKKIIDKTGSSKLRNAFSLQYFYFAPKEQFFPQLYLGENILHVNDMIAMIAPCSIDKHAGL